MLIHKPIYEAIARHDPKAARQAMVPHFNELRKSIGQRDVSRSSFFDLYRLSSIAIAS